jgi:hypothetical protein
VAADDAATVAVRSFAGSTASLREAAKWLLAAAAGVGGVLVAGLQLSQLGALGADQWLRMVIALTGLALALAGVGWVITRAAALLTEDWITLSQLTLEDFRRRLNRRAKPLKGDVDSIYDDIGRYGEELYGHVAVSPEELYQKLKDANRRARARQAPGAAADAGDGSDADADAEIRAAVVAVVEFANFRRTRADFEDLQRVLVKAAIVIVTGVVVFAIAAHSPGVDTDRSPQPSTPTAPTTQTAPPPSR